MHRAAGSRSVAQKAEVEPPRRGGVHKKLLSAGPRLICNRPSGLAGGVSGGFALVLPRRRRRPLRRGTVTCALPLDFWFALCMR